MRTVTARGWPYEYRAYIVRYDGWFRHGWKYVIEQKWVHWTHHATSTRVYKTEAEAEYDANERLDSLDGYAKERHYVEEAE